MQLIKCFVTVFNALAALIMVSFLWESVKEKSKVSMAGFGFLILLYVANTMLIWRG